MRRLSFLLAGFICVCFVNCGGRTLLKGDLGTSSNSNKDVGVTNDAGSIQWSDGGEFWSDSVIYPDRDSQTNDFILFPDIYQDAAIPITCTSSSPCNGYACNTSLGLCRTACYASSHCAYGYICNSQNKCVPNTTCSDSSVCNGYACETSVGQCRVTCSSNSHCAVGYVCSKGACVSAVKCVDDTICNGYACDVARGVCATTCSAWTSPTGCALGYSCGPNGCTQDISCTDSTPCNGFRCDTSSGICYVGCYSNQQCASGYTCGGGYKCAQQIACTDDSVCNGYVCSNGHCRVSCWNTSHHCAKGYTCNLYFGGPNFRSCMPQ